MKSKFQVFAIVATGLIFTAACGAPAATTAPTSAPVATIAPAATNAPAATAMPAATVAPAGAMIPDSAVVKAADSPLGKILVDDKGMVLYMYTKDTPNVTVCYDQCATNWPPLLTKNKPTGGAGVDASLFGTTPRKDGSMQVTYKGWPLYYFAKDVAAGDTKGQNVGKVWFVLSPAGEAIK